MELNIPTKRYYWNSRVSLDTTRKIVETFVERRSLNLTVSGRALLNEVLEEHGLNGLSKWDPAHPLIQAIETRWLELQASDQKSFNHGIIKHNGFLERIACSLEFLLGFAAPIENTTEVKVPKRNKKIKPVEVVEKAPEVSPVEIPANNTNEFVPGRYNKVEIIGSLENRKEFGKMMASARGNLAKPGDKQWSARMVAEAIEASPLAFESYMDYTGLMRTPMKANTISGIETGKFWPSAKSLHALIEFYKLSEREIEHILGLVPDPLIQSVKYNLPETSRIRQIIMGELTSVFPNEIVETESDKVSSVDEHPIALTEEEEKELELSQVDLSLTEEEADLTLPELVEALGETTPRTPPLKVAVLGQLDKATARAEAKGFGRHTVIFIDGDRPKAIPNTKFDAVVPLNRVSHTVFEKFNVLTGYPRQLRFERNSPAVRNLNGLRRWLELYDHGTVFLW